MKNLRLAVPLFLAVAALESGALATDILTNRGNIARTGLNFNETILNPTNVGSSSFGLLYNNPVDGEVYAQPLYVSNQQITPTGGQAKVANVLYVATEHDSLYAFDADTGTQYWKVSLLPTGESPVQANDPNINCTDLIPEIGITATPVIDRSAGTNGTLFVLSFSTNGTNYFHRLHAIDLSTGQDRLTPMLIAASVTGTGPATTFIAQKQRDRPGLLLLNGIIYTAWSSFCDNPSYAGWIIGYHESDLSQAGVLNVDPNGKPPSNDLPDGSGNGIWQSGNGPAVDSNGNIYVATGNGPFDTNLTGGFPTNHDFGDTVLKLSATNGLSVTDYFTPFDQFGSATADNDLGSGGPMVLPDIVDTNGTHHHLLVQAGKDANLYVLDRDNLGKFNSANNSQIYQELQGALPNGVWSSPAYFQDGSGNVFVYYGCHGDQPILQFKFDFSNPSKPLLGSNPAVTTAHFNFPGPTPTISANGTSNGILWACENNQHTPTQAVLHAWDATNVANELYNSSSLNIGTAVKFAVPTVCNGKVFVGTSNSIAAFGLNTQPPPPPSVAKDFDSDGQADLVLENSVDGHRLIWLLHNGVPTGNTIDLGTVDPSWHIGGVGDFLGNGQSDLVFERTDGEHMIWILNNGTFQSTITLPVVSGGWHVVGAGDFNGDGKADLVWENSNSGRRVIWLMNNGVRTGTISLSTVSTVWHIAGVGDFLGNGQSDLIWENTATGHRVIWLMTNGAHTGTMDLGTVGTVWHIGGTGDFLGNGQADLVWENTSNGRRVIWLMNKGVRTSTIDLGTTDPNLHIVNH